MRRGFLLIVGLALVVASTLGMIGQTQAHPVTVDGTTTEWTSFGDASGPSTDNNTGHIVRNASSQGEFFWNDEANDHRVDNTQIYTREVDLRQVRVTGDATSMYMYVNLGGTTNIGPGTNLVQLQIALDTAPGGQTNFVLPATPALTLNAPWERLLQTQFSSKGTISGSVATAPLKVYTAPAVSTTPAGAVAALSKADNTIELSVPWSALGSSGPPSTPVDVTVVSLRDDGSAPSDGIPTNILDTISPTLNGVGGLTNTTNELSDGKIDYSFRVNFAPTGEVYSPLLISEVSLLPSTASKPNGDSTVQWFELTNVSGGTLTGSTLAQYKVGDATERGSSESMFSLAKLGSVSLAANTSLVFTRDRTKFKSAYNFTNTQMNSVYVLTTTGTLSLDPYPAWAGTNFGFSTSTATQFNDQVVLLDNADTLADLVEYSTTPNSTDHYPDHLPVAVPFTGTAPSISLPVNTDIQRCPTNRDTNNRDPLTPDFVVSTVQTPLSGCTFTDLYATITGPQTIQVQVQAATTQNYTIAYGNNRQPASGVVISDTLPTGMTYVAGSTQGAGEPTVGTDMSGRRRLVWSIGTVANAATGQIAFTTSVAASATAPAASQHDLTISGSSASPELQADLTNNAFNLAVAYSTEPVVNLAVTKTLNTSKSQLYAGGKLVYILAYSNTGNKAASDVTLIDTFPSGLTYLSNSAGLTTNTPAAGQIQFTVVKAGGQPLAAGGSGSFEVTFAIPESLNQGSVVPANQVAISTSTTPEDASNNTASSQAATLGARPPAADLEVTTHVQDDSAATPGGTVVYTVAYSNSGQLNASSVTLTDSFPDGLEYVSNSARLTPDQSVAGQLKFSVVPMAPGDHAAFQLTFKVKSSVAVGTAVQNQITIATASVEAPSSNNIATSETTTIHAAGGTTTPTPAKQIVYLPVVRK